MSDPFHSLIPVADRSIPSSQLSLSDYRPTEVIIFSGIILQFKTEEQAKQEQEAIDLDVSTKPEVPHQDEADADASDSSGDGADAPDFKDVKDSFRWLAARLVSQKVDLVIDPKDESQLAQALKRTCAVREVPEGPEKYRAIIYDSKTSGEAATCPWWRLPQ